MPLGREADLGPRPRDIVLDGDPAAPKGAQPPIFGPCLLLPNGWIDTPLGTEVVLGQGHIVLDGDIAPSERGTETPSFRSMSIVAKRSPISATAQHLFYAYYTYTRTSRNNRK